MARAARKAPPSKPDPAKWYTVAEVAERYALSVRQVRRLIGEERLIAINVSSGEQRATYRISGSALARYELTSEAS